VKGLGTGGFDVTRALDFEPTFREPHYPFEWAGLYTCGTGCYRLELSPGPASTLAIALLRVDGDEAGAIAAATGRASHLFATAGAVARASGQVVLSGSLYQRLLVKRDESTHFHVMLPTGGRYVLFTQHLPREFDLVLTGPQLMDERYFAPEQALGDGVNCVRLTVHEPLHAVRFQRWLERLLRGGGGKLIRLRGCLNFAGSADRIEIQWVQGSMDTRVLEPWGDRERATELVLIGRNLATRELLWHLRDCVAR
jgi:G3E family GTPase